MSPSTSLIRQRVVRGTLSNAVGRAVALGSGFLLTPFILGRLGAVDFGLWMLVNSVVGYGSLLDLGIGGTVTKYVAEYRARGESDTANALIATAWIMYSLLGLAMIAASAVLGLVFPAWFNIAEGLRGVATTLVLLSGVSVGLSLPAALTIAILRGLHRFDVVNAIAVVVTLASLTATVVLLLTGAGVVGVVSLGIPAVLGTQIAGIVCIRRFAPDLRVGWQGADRRLVGTIASFGSSLFVMDIAGRLQNKSDDIVIAASMPVAAITPYALARRLSDVAQTVTDQFMRVLLPLASELHAVDDRRRLRGLYLTSTRLSLALFVPLGAAIALLAGPILAVWVGPAYADNAPLVGILVFASLVATSQWPAGSILQGMSRHRFLAVSSLTAGLGTIVLSIVLVRSLGLAGVALGIAIPTCLEALGLVLPYTLHVVGVTPGTYARRVLIPALLPALPMGVVLLGLNELVQPMSWLGLLVISACGATVYAAGYLLSTESAAERLICAQYARTTIQFVQTRLQHI